MYQWLDKLTIVRTMDCGLHSLSTAALPTIYPLLKIKLHALIISSNRYVLARWTHSFRSYMRPIWSAFFLGTRQQGHRHVPLSQMFARSTLHRMQSSVSALWCKESKCTFQDSQLNMWISRGRCDDKHHLHIWKQFRGYKHRQTQHPEGVSKPCAWVHANSGLARSSVDLSWCLACKGSYLLSLEARRYFVSCLNQVSKKEANWREKCSLMTYTWVWLCTDILWQITKECVQRPCLGSPKASEVSRIRPKHQCHNNFLQLASRFICGMLEVSLCVQPCIQSV